MIIWADPHSVSGIAFGMLVVGTMLITGFATPLAALLQSLLQLLIALRGTPLLSIHAENVLVGLSLMMLGPGAWSTDAYLFGRRRITIGGK